VFTVKEPISENRAALEAIVKEWNQRMDGTLTFGWTFENPNKGFVLSAWESLEVRMHHQIVYVVLTFRPLLAHF
jgi:hypothetical protein